MDVNRVTSLGHCRWIGFVAKADSWLAEAFAERSARLADPTETYLASADSTQREMHSRIRTTGDYDADIIILLKTRS